MSEKAANARIRFLVLGFVVVFGVALARAAYVQVVEGSRDEQLASRQHRETIEIPAARGTIYDRTGEPLAIGEQATTVYADPRNVVAPMKAAIKAGETLGIDPDELYPALRDRTKRFVYVERKADPVKAKDLERLGVMGFGFYAEERRAYPQGRVAAHVLGFAGTDNQGLDGLERSLDKTLAGKSGFEIVVRDPLGRAIDVITSRKERPGRNVVLTLDHQLQASAEQLLANAVLRWRARGATAIVMDPRSGAILAMANAPTFDANGFSTAPADARRNRAVTDLYEPGSTFKIVTVAAALEDNLVSPEHVLPARADDRRRRPDDPGGATSVAPRRMTVRADPLRVVERRDDHDRAEARRDRARVVDRTDSGSGSGTGVDFPGESPGLVLPVRGLWSGSTIGTVPIGQGIAVTPLQMVSAYAAIGNGGVIPPAHLIAKVGGKKVHHGKGRRIVSRHTADRMTAMFRDVVVEGTGTEAAIPGYTVAGKTGTANKAENGGYVSKYVASFVGLVPARKPRLAILVMVDEPRGQIWGGVVAAPIFRDIARFALQYLEVPPDAPESKRSSSLLAAVGTP